MVKNLIPIIAKELGVEIGEEFKISSKTGVIYRFTNKSLEVRYKDDGWIDSGLKVNVLCRSEITKLPFEPKLGEEYWSYIILADKWKLKKFYWDADIMDYFSKNAGCVFRTKEEAIAALPAKYKELTGKEWFGDA